MLRFAAAPTATTSPTSAVTSLAHAAHSNIFYSSFSSLDSISVSAASLKLTSYRVKAMADTLSNPKLDSKSSVAGRRQALISLSDKNDLALLGRGLQDLGLDITLRDFIHMCLLLHSQSIYYTEEGTRELFL
ncbi:bifunctional purine biosynthesis [Olea europaea subsp. europaea]|uniref:Bifunctional purine biosynthesis n=1 Tax=Olea europaea subsp. europaea TaxID=158383 RepID=A0A8S0QBX0_OLEEU|nr:bifunctional purine biosynthesis [Olea europaea subsp. europaea]